MRERGFGWTFVFCHWPPGRVEPSSFRMEQLGQIYEPQVFVSVFSERHFFQDSHINSFDLLLLLSDCCSLQSGAPPEGTFNSSDLCLCVFCFRHLLLCHLFEMCLQWKALGCSWLRLCTHTTQVRVCLIVLRCWCWSASLTDPSLL